MKAATIIRLVIFLILIGIIVVNYNTIADLEERIANTTIVTIKNDSLIATTALSYNDKLVVLDPQLVDTSTKLGSPFRDSLSYGELLEKYIRNRWADYYGMRRGTKECRRIHEGVDLFVPENTPVYPIAPFGIVTEVSDNPHYMIKVACKREDGSPDSVKVEYGKIVRVLYPEGFQTIYAHLNEVFVEIGQVVNLDTKLGVTGITGNLKRSGKASHLHMEFRDSNDESFDPKYRYYYKGTDFEHFLDFFSL
ncbi:MAG: M23 family metallopeptidase [Candidatus Cloacimonadota bacterium]|nr:M23 family metallopeptidase [Candidatus Cloacimonadota bacterium]